MNWLKQLVSDGGMPSAMRVMSLVIVIPVMIVWTVLCIRQNQFIIPDTKVLLMLVTAVGGKTLQSFAERPTSAAAWETAAQQIKNDTYHAPTP